MTSRGSLLKRMAVVAVIGLALAAAPARANDIASFKTVFATDVAYAGYGGVRGGDGTGTLTLSGVTGDVTEAYLYWQGPTNSEDLAANAAISFDGTNITGENIGLSASNCWSFENSHAYRADVTSLVDGDGAYPVANLIKPQVADISGLSLLVFYDDGDDGNNRDVVLFEGNDSTDDNEFDADGWNVNLAGINYDGGAATLDLHVADGQSFADGAIVANTVEILAAGANFEGDTVPNGPTAGNTNGGLWDIRSFDIQPLLSDGPNDLAMTSAQNSDCLSLVVAAVNLPAGSAPNQPTTTTTSTTSTTSTTAAPGETTTTTAAPVAPPAAQPQAQPATFTG